MNLDENLRMTIPEIQPLQDNKEKEENYVVPELPQKKPSVPFENIKTQVRFSLLRSYKNILINKQSNKINPK